MKHNHADKCGSLITTNSAIHDAVYMDFLTELMSLVTFMLNRKLLRMIRTTDQSDIKYFE